MIIFFISGRLRMGSIFFFNDTATTEIYTLSLHDALPILSRQELRSTGGNCQGDDRQESCSSAGNCQAACFMCCEGHLRFNHPKLSQMTTCFRFFCTESRSESKDFTKGHRPCFSIELTSL